MAFLRKLVMVWLLALAIPVPGLAAATMIHCGSPDRIDVRLNETVLSPAWRNGTSNKQLLIFLHSPQRFQRRPWVSQSPDDHVAHHPAAAASAVAMTEGETRKVESEGRRQSPIRGRKAASGYVVIDIQPAP
jgi:hypothetical protein